MRRHLIGDENFFHIARQIKSLRYVCDTHLQDLGSMFPEPLAKLWVDEWQSHFGSIFGMK